ncbi:MAG: fused MFS/spermidine synthase [Verrucomicrobia bacterium]|nr:fused MFS/spermidine synthase [Verrucomicrobiota bacterium]
MPSERGHFLIGLALTLLSGAAALSHQLLWTHRMTDLLGFSAQSTTRVFSCFFLGLSIGAGVIGFKISNISRPWRWLAFAEWAVAVFCLPSLFLSHWTDWIWPSLGADRLTGWQGAGVKTLLSMAVVFLPAWFMGTTLPLLIRGVIGSRIRTGHTSVWLYALNTGGGLLGLATTAGFSLYALGVGGSMLVAIALNVLVGLVSFWMDSRSPSIVPDKTKVRSTYKLRDWIAEIGWRVIITVFASGFLILALEILAMDLVMLVAPLSFHAPMAVLGVFIFALAIAAALAPALGAKFPCSRKFMSIVLMAVALTTVACPFVFVHLAMKTKGIGEAGSLYEITKKLVMLVSLTFGPGLLLGGLVFPRLLMMIPRNIDKSAVVGFLLAVNGLGGLIGAEMAYRILLPLFGVHSGIGIIAVLYVFLAVSWQPFHWKTLKPVQGLILLCTLVVVPGLFSRLGHLPVVNPHVGLKVLDLKFGREGNLAVVEHDKFGRGLLFSNQYLLGTTNVRYDQERQAHLPLLLHPEPKKVCFIGLATGITPSAALQHSTVESIEVIELSSMVVDAALRYFAEYNHPFGTASEARIVVEDGRTYIASQQNTYDAIVSDLFLPWRPGVGRLYSREHFQSVKGALRSGGIFCQWLPLYQFTDTQLQLVIRTFLTVFSDAYLFEGKFDLDAPVLGLVGFKDTILNWDRVRQSCDREQDANGIKDPTMRHIEGLAMLYRGKAFAQNDKGVINTLDNMHLELNAGLDRMIKTNGEKYLIKKNWFDWASLQLNSDHFFETREVTRKLAAQGLLIGALNQKIHREPASKNTILKQVFTMIPQALIADQTSDWDRWGGPELNLRWRPKETNK